MGKAPLKIIRNRRSGDRLSVDAGITQDCKTFYVRLEGGKPASWPDYLHMIMDWACEELKALEMAPDEKSH